MTIICPTPQALRSASIYQIFPRNCSREGTLQAAASRLAEVKQLGFDYVYLTPIHPIGKSGARVAWEARTQSRTIAASTPSSAARGGGGLHRRGAPLDLGMIMDVVYNHTSPDSVLVREHSEWFWKGPDGRPGPRIAEWSDVVDLDYSHKELWDYQIESLAKWADFGVDGFRCDVASLVPVEFWVEARAALASRRGTGRAPLLWLAESVHKDFVIACRRRGLYAASDPELHAAFDITYDYDGRGYLEAAWVGELSLITTSSISRPRKPSTPPTRSSSASSRTTTRPEPPPASAAARGCATGPSFRCSCRGPIWPTWARSCDGAAHRPLRSRDDEGRRGRKHFQAVFRAGAVPRQDYQG